MKKGIRIVSKDGKRVVEGLGYYDITEVNDLRQIVKNSAQKYGDAIGFKFKDAQGKIIGKTYREFEKDIDCLGTVLCEMGLKGMRFAVISENRYEWCVCYLSATNGCGVAVPLDKYLPQIEVETLVERGKVDVIFYSPAYHDMMCSILQKNERLKYYICMEDLTETPSDPKFLALPKLLREGRFLMDAGNRSFVDIEPDRTGMSILLFTSGTTSMAKGVMLSHTNIVANVKSIAATIRIYSGDVHLSLLPLHHTFENTVGFLFMVYSGVCIAYCDGIKHIAQNLKEYHVTILVAVPAILESIYRRLREGIAKSGKEKALNLLISVSDFLRRLGIDLRRKLFKSVFEQFAPNVRLAVSGAAPLDPAVVIWFEKIGFNLLQGYGLTETSPVVAANNDDVNVPGTIGYPLKDVEVAILDPDENGMGEIITRGPNVMLGYYENTEDTADVLLQNGWFRTGDLGTIDEKGLIRITGRAKSMIVFNNGKKAFPEEYETLLNNIPGVKDSFVWGNIAADGDIQACAEIVLDQEAMEGISEADISIRLETAIHEINKNLPQYKIIRYFVFTFVDLVKTTTMKVKRNIELDKVLSAVKKSGLDMRKLSGSALK